MSFLHEHEQAARTADLLLAIIEQPGQFNALFAQYREAEGPIDGNFLDHLPIAREVWRRAAEPAAVADVLALPLAFREAVLHGLARDRQADALQRCLDATSDRTAKKTLKRLLYELRQAGCTPQPTKRNILVSRAPAAEPAPPCCLSMVDAANERLLIIIRPDKGGMQLLEVLEGGDAILSFRHDFLSRKGTRRLVDELRARTEIPLVEIDLPVAVYLLYQVLARSEAAGRLAPAGLTRALTEMRLAELRPARHPYHDLIDGQAVLEQLSSLNHSDRLHDEPEFQTWMLDQDTLRKTALALQETATSQLVIDEAQRRGQMIHRLTHAMDSFFTESRRAIYAERLRDTAYLLARRGAVAQAQETAALALRLENAHIAPSSIPFFLRLLTKVLPVPPVENEKDQPAGGLILS